MKYYIILNKQNEILTSFSEKEQAECFVKHRQYLRVQEFDDEDVTESENIAVTDDLPF